MTNSVESWIATESTDLIGENRKISVTGTVETTNTNQTPSLSEAAPQGFNPTILILDLAITVSGVGLTVMTPREVFFAKPCGEGQYKQVQIRGAGVEVTVDVQVVHS
jgi:hypothetical protein